MRRLVSSLQLFTDERSSGTGVEPVRVLVVDDDSVLARAIQRVLRLEGFYVDTVLDGRTALQRLDGDAFDVVLLDMQMAHMDGMEVFKAMRERPSPPATIIHSAHIDVRTAVLATRAGVDEVMQKPVPEEILSARIRELAAARRAGRNRPCPEAFGPTKVPDALLRLVGGSGPMVELREHVRRVAYFRDLSVLIQGPTGTGKELVAQAVHAVTCPEEPFVSVNCAAVPEHLFESELFGHEAGAFTNAKACHIGLLEEAGRGTLFLDEVGEMPIVLQTKLLRALEIRQFRRVGGNRTRILSARVVSATNRSLASELKTSMRADLFYRLAGYTIPTPSLSQHLTDLPALAAHFLDDFARRHRFSAAVLSSHALEALLAHSWPGNVRELRAVVENASVLARGGTIGGFEVERALEARGALERPADSFLPSALEPPDAPTLRAPRHEPANDRVAPEPHSRAPSGVRRAESLPDMQRDVILRAFEESQHNLTQAARSIGIPRTTLRARLRKYGAR
jgi:DNA-binding NtrC family response regulator